MTRQQIAAAVCQELRRICGKRYKHVMTGSRRYMDTHLRQQCVAYLRSIGWLKNTAKEMVGLKPDWNINSRFSRRRQHERRRTEGNRGTRTEYV